MALRRQLPGDFQIWPTKKDGLWDFPLELLPYGNNIQALSMDFNFLYNQSGGATQGDPAKFADWEKKTVDSYMVASTGSTTAAGRPCSSATTSRTGTAAST